MKLRAIACVVVASGLVAACSPNERPPDIVFLSLDTTRADHLGVYGYSRPVSPSLDAFARDAVVFERAWTTAPWTLPAHASMFTGQHPTSHGAHFDLEHGSLSLGGGLAKQRGISFRANPLDASAITLAELAAERGYATGAFVGGPWLGPEFGVLQGFEHVVFDVTDTGGTRAPVLTRAAIGWLETLPEDQPALLFVNYFDPHAPYDPPERFRELAREGSLRPGKEGPLLRKQREVIERYDGEIRFMDHYVGGLLATLRRVGRYDDAVIVVVADHGELFGEHQQLGHRSWLYEELLRVPLLVRYRQGREGGRRSQAPVSVVDLLPLIAKEAGLPLPPGVEGQPIGSRELVLAESYRDALGIANDPALDRDLFAAIRWPWKLIASSAGERQHFRLDRDPKEQEPLGPSDETATLEAALAAARATLRPPERRATAREVSPEAEQQLRDLGYLEAE
jgi:arylsulfatase A-like enzyme